MNVRRAITGSRERAEVAACLHALANEPGHVRCANKGAFLDAMREFPERVVEYVRMLQDGTYGTGWKEAAKEHRGDARGLCILVASVEWQCPQKEAAMAWSLLTAPERAALVSMIEGPRMAGGTHGN